jgi:hypothetical protein
MSACILESRSLVVNNQCIKLSIVFLHSFFKLNSKLLSVAWSSKTYVDLRQLNHMLCWEGIANRRSWEFLWKYKNYIIKPLNISKCKVIYFIARDCSLIISIKSLNLPRNIQWVVHLLAFPLLTQKRTAGNVFYCNWWFPQPLQADNRTID